MRELDICLSCSYDRMLTILALMKIEKVAAFCGLQLTRVPRVKDIEHEVVI
jgi:hypothetical protein